MNRNSIFTLDPADALADILPDNENIIILTDSNTNRLALPVIIARNRKLNTATTIVIPPGDENKNLRTLESVWHRLSDSGATRHSILLNIGGGMVTDLGGFAAATFKRGIRFVNIPTSLLGAVDASVGGKTGINFCNLKNEIGVFAPAQTVIISPVFFATLPQRELLSGYAEMLKHALIDSTDALKEIIGFDFSEITGNAMLDMLKRSVSVKERIVGIDPHEKGLRRALNFGHTIGHAFESLALERNEPIPHGYAVAWGIVVECILSHMLTGFSSDTLQRIAAFVLNNYGAPVLTCNDYPHMLSIMRHDKKNRTADEINFTLLESPGNVKIDRTADRHDILAALDIFRDLMHI